MSDTSRIEITRTEKDGVVTFCGPCYALDVTRRNPERIHPAQERDTSWHSALDDDPSGTGVTTRLHAYGKERLLEIKALVERGLDEIETQEQGRD